jgi:hypothetical protein
MGEELLLFPCFLLSEVRGKGVGDLFSPADKGLDAFLELAAWQKHAMVAPAAFEADVGPQAYHPPLITAARVWFSQANYIAQSDLHGHCPTAFFSISQVIISQPARYG